MISRIRAKRVTALILLMILALVGLGILAVTAKVVLNASSGADADSAFHEVAAVPENADKLVTWLPDAWQRQRVLEPSTRKSVESAYIRAWAAVGRLQTTGNSDNIADTFIPKTGEMVISTAKQGDAATWALAHRLELTFYSLDGATVAFRDVGASVARSLGNGPSELMTVSTEDYEVVMVLQDGYWRVAQLRRGAVGSTVTVSSPTTGRTTLDGLAPRPISRTPSHLSTLYRPGTWGKLDPAAVTRDFHLARDMGLTGIRIPLSYEALGGDTPSSEALKDLSTVAAAADQQGLHLTLVLFDGVSDFSPSNWPQLTAHLRAIFTAVKTSTGPILWDLAEAPDKREGGKATSVEMKAFLCLSASEARTLDPAAQLTITWGSADSARDPVMAELVDVVGFSISGYSGSTEAELRNVGDHVAGRPVEIVVTGADTAGGWDPLPHTETRQARALATAVQAARREGIHSVTAAALRDDTIHSDGLVTSEGISKPAAQTFTTQDLASVPAPSVIDYVTSRFWIAVGLVAALAALYFRRTARRRRVADAGS